MANTVLANYQALAERAAQNLKDRGEEGKIRIQVGAATCENAAGAKQVLEEFKRHIEASGRADIVLRQTGCTGRCSREPIVNVIVPGAMPVKYEAVDRDLVHSIFTQHIQGGKPVYRGILDWESGTVPDYELLFCSGTRCGSARETTFRQAAAEKLKARGLPSDRARIISAACFGLCGSEIAGRYTHVLVRPSKVIYRLEREADLDEIIEKHILQGQTVERLLLTEQTVTRRFFDLYGDVAFFNHQSRLALRNSGIVDPENIDEYISLNGFAAIAAVLSRNDPRWVIAEIDRSKLRGRGGAGYPTGTKWNNAAMVESDVKFVICNADEGDPGAFMDRSMLEGDPFSVIEGMMIGAFAIGAHEGFLYIRAEYPLAIERIEHALDVCRERGLLGTDILGSGYGLELEVRLGAGAFVCGEETSLIHSIEGSRGQPRIRPPYPAIKGLWGAPTVINNVETWANVPVIINYGADWFSRVGSAESGGTKVFALAGKIRHTGLVEVPMGTPLTDIVNTIGGGVAGGRTLKAVQTGGPAGGCIPAANLSLLVDYESLTQAGSIMGSGGMIVMDDEDCMVDVAKFYIGFSQLESCGKCTPCREGTMRMLEILERITAGDGCPDDLEKLERLGRLLRKNSLCGLGRAAPNPLLSTLEHFRDEYEAHVFDKRCPAGKCQALVSSRR